MTIRPHQEGWFVNLAESMPDEGGAYVVRALGDDGQAMPIGRALGVDPEGILYIGKATRFVSRVAHLVNRLEHDDKTVGHEFVRRYRASEKAQAAFPLDCLVVDLYPSSDPAEEERARLNQYIAEWAEPPPFNRSG